eukprot:TRINITY_DN6946_c0_g1_i2.p2 TRINITY_DN6946_c0_g1~~TRINITY_DN6946_c0_g1_i2.p2  ORF type:complete len:318 (-),score=32.68 TRINITY_DN6946_c0_g1_i2:62-1015(-)
MQHLPVVLKPKEMQKKPDELVGKRKKPDVDLSAITDIEEQRRQKRLMKNRRTAANSRAKKRQELEELHQQLEHAIALHNDKADIIEQMKAYCMQLQQCYENQTQELNELRNQNTIKDRQLQSALNLLASHGIDAGSEEARCHVNNVMSPAGSVDGSAVLVSKQLPVVLDGSSGNSTPTPTPAVSFSLGGRKVAGQTSPSFSLRRCQSMSIINSLQSCVCVFVLFVLLQFVVFDSKSWEVIGAKILLQGVRKVLVEWYLQNRFCIVNWIWGQRVGGFFSSFRLKAGFVGRSGVGSIKIKVQRICQYWHLFQIVMHPNG